MLQNLLIAQGLPIIEASRSHSDAPESVGLLWTLIIPTQIFAPDNTQPLQKTDIHATGGILTHSGSKRVAAEPRFDRADTWIGCSAD